MTDEALRWDRIGLNYLYQIRDVNIDELDDETRTELTEEINDFIDHYPDEVDDGKFREVFEIYLDNIALRYTIDKQESLLERYNESRK